MIYKILVTVVNHILEGIYQKPQQKKKKTVINMEDLIDISDNMWLSNLSRCLVKQPSVYVQMVSWELIYISVHLIMILDKPSKGRNVRMISYNSSIPNEKNKIHIFWLEERWYTVIHHHENIITLYVILFFKTLNELYYPWEKDWWN